jgi:hypothetical protein
MINMPSIKEKNIRKTFFSKKTKLQIYLHYNKELKKN